MINPMKKISLVVMGKFREDCLKKLRETGVLHIEEKYVSSPLISELFEKRAKAEESLLLLKTYEAKAKPHTLEVLEKSTQPHERAADSINPMGIPVSLDALNMSGGKRQEISLHISSLEERRLELTEKEYELSLELDRIRPWGNFIYADLHFLEQRGIHLYFYEFAPGILRYLSGDIPYIVVKKTKKSALILALSRIPSEIPVKFGEFSLSQLEEIYEDTKKQLADIENQFISLYFRKHVLEEEIAEIGEKIDFETANERMGSLEMSGSSGISWIEGYVPADNTEGLVEAANENTWALLVSDPSPADAPPTILKTKSIARVVQPLFKMLGTIPGYWEHDISSLYMFFFCIFFAMIFGDAGYGLIFMLCALAIGIVTKIKTGKFADFSILLLILSGFTILWGSFIGAWFSIPHEALPGFLRVLILDPFNNSGPLVEFPVFLQNIFNLPPVVPVDTLKTRWNIQFLCFSIAAIQLISARLYLASKIFPKLSALTQIGWIFTILGVYFLVLSLLLKISLPSFVPYFLVSGIISYFVFSEQKGGNFFANIFKSFSSFFSFFLGLIGCFGDIISYIRLFAVGLAGSLIAQTVNSLAISSGGLQDGIGSFGADFALKLAVTAMILFFGHFLNVLMNGLSLIVHGVRLNLLEFAGNHLGMEWSGYEYNPFAIRQNAERQNALKHRK